MPSRASLLLRHIFHNQRIRLRHQLGRTGGYSGSRTEPPADRARHLHGVFERYLQLSGVPREDLLGRTLLELGPGDSLAVAMLFARAGCARVTVVDRFRYDYDTHYALDIEKSLGLDPQLRGHIGIRCGVRLEQARLEPASFDYIVSNAVLEEIPHVDRTLETLERLLRPGGRMLHQIDLSDYGIFSRHGFSPFEFLTVSDAFWRVMTDSCGGPNRYLLPQYREQMRRLGLNARIHTTHQYDTCTVFQLEQIRPRLLARYRLLPIDDFLPSGIFVVAEKP